MPRLQQDCRTGAAVGRSAGSSLVQERSLEGLLQQPPDRGSVGGSNSELVEQCFTATPVFQFYRYREPGSAATAGVGPLPLQHFIAPNASSSLAQHADDNNVLSQLYRNSSFGQQVTLLHHTWNALHPCTSLQQIRVWLEQMPSHSHIILV